jgi:transposase
MNRKPKMQRFPLKAFQKQFPDDAACLEWLKNYLYPDGIYCKNCEEITKHYRVVSRPSYCCEHCGNHVHPTAGTIFHKSPTPLTTWFYAMYLMSATRCGISAKQIERETGVTYKTAWRMFKQIRSMLDETENAPKLGGSQKPVEVDEMYYGGRQRGHQGRASVLDKKAKTPVVGLVQRKGNVRAFVTPDVKKDTVQGLIKEHVLPSNLVFTDDYSIYDGLERTKYNYYHRRINHSEKVYVAGNVHTQTIEGFWSLVKNGIKGVYHSVGRHYLQSYLNEYSFRYNRRFDEQPMFLSFLQQVEKRDAVVRRGETIPEPF